MSTQLAVLGRNCWRRVIPCLFLSQLHGAHVRWCATKPKKKFRFFILSYYINYIKKYETVLEQRFPAAVQLYRIFSIGVKEFKRDTVLLMQIFKKVNVNGYKCLTRKEMELYFEMPKDMLRVSPVLLVSALPFGGAAFPLAYMFPRTMLSSHFWSLQQRSEFAMADHKRKLIYYRPVFRCLQAQLRLLKDSPLHKSWSKVLGLLGSGAHPTATALLDCKMLFEGEPYHLSQLYAGHVSYLLCVHNMHRGWRRRSRLADRAFILHEMDLAMLHEGGPASLTQEDLRKACFFRGLNPTNMCTSDMLEWLSQWLLVSQHVSKQSYSLLLHCPVLLAYNQPSNWSLLVDNRIRP